MKAIRVKVAKTVTKNYLVRNRNFVIVQFDDGFYGAIEYKYITDGKLNTELNGLQMHRSDVLANCLEQVRNNVEIEYLKNNGYTLGQAMCKVFNLPIEKAVVIDAM